MENRRSTGTVDRAAQSRVVPWDRLETRAASMFVLAGALLVGSLVVPVGLRAVTEWAWVSGVVLAGLGVAAASTGLFGLYPRVRDEAPRLAGVGVLSAAIAGVAALSLIAMGGTALVGEGALGMDLGKPVGIFVVVTLSMAVGSSLGFLSIGAAGRRSDGVSGTSSRLLLLAGAVLVVPIAGEITRRGFGIESGIPPWIFLPVLGAVTLLTLALGYSLRTGS